MGRVRVCYHPDGRVVVAYPNQRMHLKPKSITNDEWITAQFADSELRNHNLHVDKDLTKPLLPYEEMDESELPDKTTPTDEFQRDRWRGSKGVPITVSGTVVLRQDLIKQLKEELAKPTPNTTKTEGLRGKIINGEYDNGQNVKDKSLPLII